MDINGSEVVVRLRQEGQDRGGTVRYTLLGVYPREEAERVARAKAAEFGDRAQINDYRWYINVWVPLGSDADRARLRRLREAYECSMSQHGADRDDLRHAVLELIEHGTTEAEAGRLAGVTRKTIRSWRGKK